MRPPSTASAVGRFLAGSVLAIAVVVVGGFFALRSVTVDEAERATREQVLLEGRLVQSAGLEDGILRGDAAAVRKLDDLALGQVVTGSTVRMKLWTRDGRILYSDEPQLIGQRFELGDEELELFDTGGADAELSDLSEPENRFERQEGRLLEAHTVIRTPDGTPVLFETYQRFSSINASGSRLLRAIAPPLLAGLAVLLIVQVPLALSLARRLQRGYADQEALLHSAIEASDAERRRIAADLHDGVVQDVAGVAFGLAPMADAAEQRGDRAQAASLRDAIASLRQGVRGLRTLLVEIHPPTLAAAGLEAALQDLLTPLAADGVRTSLEIDEVGRAGTAHDPLVYRIAREALRNAAEHSGAGAVRVAVSHPDGSGIRLEVTDDGRGFAPQDRAASERAGHVGLRLLDGLVRQSGGTLAVRSAPGAGTTVTLELGA